MFSTLLGHATSRIGDPKPHVMLPRNNSSRRPSVSVVVPCYNYGHFIKGCVRSVLNQKDVDVDVLVIDDASSDHSQEVISDLAAHDERIRTIFHATNRGHIATYNEGLAQAIGDYTVLLSADDLLTPGSLSRATSLMEEHPSVGLTYGFSVDFTESPVPPARTNAAYWLVWKGHNWLRQTCKSGRNPLRSPEAIMRTSVLQEIGYYSANLPHAADFELWMRAATVSDVGYVGGADQAYYRIHKDNMHNTSYDVISDFSQRLSCFDTIFSERSGFIGDAKPLRESACRALAREALGHAISAYARGAANHEPVDDYAAFALRAWPDAKQLGEWRVFRKLRMAPDNPTRWDFSLLTREKTRTLKYSLLWWRRRWAGI